MKRLLSAICVAGLLLLLISKKNSSQGSNDYSSDYSQAQKIYKKADQLSARADADERIQGLQNELYNQALTWYKTAAVKATRAANDSIHFHSLIKIGLISLYLDSERLAKESYLEAVALKPHVSGISDSFLFKPCLFLGGIFYQQNQFDSASLYYQKAEQLLNSYGTILDESQRLYNRQGALYYETGNYRLAKTYFEKALSLLSPKDPSYLSLMVNYKMNIASISVKLEQFEDAKNIYVSLLPYNVYENEIWHNIGIIDNRLGNFHEAIDDLRKVKYSGAKRIDLDYNLALAFDSLNERDSVEFYIHQASVENGQFNATNKSTAWGLVLKFVGDKNRQQGRYTDALRNYQKAIIQFDLPFNEGNISKNPTEFTGIFSYINLFKTLTAKAGTYEELYPENKDNGTLQAALDAYRSAFRLADYVEKTYESDESRLFLNDIKYKAHGKPIDVCLRLYELTHEQHYLEQAYFFDQRNKASILAFNLHVAGHTGIFSETNKQVQDLKTSITRLSLKESQATDSSQVAEINRQISNYEIQLARLQQQLNNDPRYAQIQPSEWIPSVSTLQNRILDKKSAILSYHLSPNHLLAFVVTYNTFNYHQQPIDEDFFQRITSYVTELRQVGGGQKYQGDSISSALYQVLIKPILPFAGSCERLIVVPDDELSYIPFEALKSESNRYLIQNFSVQYQYSTALLNINSKTKNISSSQTLAFAPFLNPDPQNRFDALKYSRSEVENLEGKVFLGSNATKRNFLASANHYRVIHLATHANADDQSPLYSSIVFFPVGPDSSYRLYAQEIYNLRLDSVQLVILSACETGTGQLVRGEGLMSLSRAIAYAGCPNVVTSLWKAEDKTTAFITERLHYYLRRNHSIDKALQEAKLDLLGSKEIEPQFKAPSYWAHLIFIGNYQAEERNYLLYWIIAGVVLISMLVLLYLKRKTWLQKPG